MLLQKSIFDKTIKIITDENKRFGTMLKRIDNNDDKLIHKYLYDSITEENSLPCIRENIPIAMVSELSYLKDAIQKIKVNILNDKSFEIQNFDPYHFVENYLDPYLWNITFGLFGEKLPSTKQHTDLNNY